MIRHYITVALRNLRKYPAQSIISVLGLAAGFVCLSLSALWMHYENTYDTMHEDYERIYTFTKASSLEYAGSDFSSNRLIVPSTLARTLRSEYPEVEAVTYCRFEEVPDKINGINASMMMIDTTFIRVFALPLVQGDYGFLVDDEEMAVTEEFAKKLFPDDDEYIGKELTISGFGGYKFKVGAVVKGYGEHSIFQFDVLSARRFLLEGEAIPIFAKVYETVDVESFTNRVGQFLHWGLPQDIVTIPIADAHKLAGNYLSLSWEHLRVFFACSILLVVCALINYLMLYLTRLRGREREMALRIVNGSTIGGLMTMFLIEVGIMLIIAMIVGVVGVEWIHPSFVRFTSIDMDYGHLIGSTLLIMLATALVCFVLCIAPIAIVRKRTLTGRTRRNDTFRKVSSFVQLTVSMIFIFCTVVMLHQIVYMRNADWGFNIRGRAQLYVTRSNDESYEQWMQKRHEVVFRLRKEPMVTDIIEYGRDFAATIYMDLSGMMGLSPEALNTFTLSFKGVEDIGNPSHGFTLLEGTLPREGEWQSNEVVITESVRKELGLDQAVGHTVYTPAGLGYPYRDNSVNQFTVIAVIKDIFFHSPTHKAYNIVFFTREKGVDVSYYDDSGYSIISFMPSERKEFTRRVHEIMERDFPKLEYKIEFSEDIFNKRLKSETNLMLILGIITLVCILVAIFGVYSIVTLACAQRRKEIALRKIHGATLRDILSIFIKEYGLIVAAASAVAFPIGYIIMKQWIVQYVKQASIAWWIYVGIFLAIVLLIALSVGSRVWRTVRENPAEVVKSGN